MVKRNSSTINRLCGRAARWRTSQTGSCFLAENTMSWMPIRQSSGERIERKFDGDEKWVTDEFCERMGRKNTTFNKISSLYFLNFCINPKREVSDLTITAEKTHLWVFTFPAPKPILAASFHYQSTVFHFEKEGKKETPDLLLTHIFTYLKRSSSVQCVVQDVRITYPREHVSDGTSGIYWRGNPCWVRIRNDSNGFTFYMESVLKSPSAWCFLLFLPSSTSVH